MLMVALLVINCPLLLTKVAYLSTAEIKERVELYFYCPSVPSWQTIV
jgi:hypothetical protein